jgi:predicted ATP-binding protein involved in virulence
MLYHKSALLEASNARIADLEVKLNTKDACMQKDKNEIELIKEQCNKQLSALKEECRVLKEMKCQYEENKEEEYFKKKFLEDLPKFSSDMVMVDSNASVSDQDAKFRLSMMVDEGNCDDASVLTPK